MGSPLDVWERVAGTLVQKQGQAGQIGVEPQDLCVYEQDADAAGVSEQQAVKGEYGTQFPLTLEWDCGQVL